MVVNAQYFVDVFDSLDLVEVVDWACHDLRSCYVLEFALELVRQEWNTFHLDCVLVERFAEQLTHPESSQSGE